MIVCPGDVRRFGQIGRPRYRLNHPGPLGLLANRQFLRTRVHYRVTPKSQEFASYATGVTKFSGGESSVLANWVDFLNPTPGAPPWHGR